jgi:hypothetical protein
MLGLGRFRQSPTSVSGRSGGLTGGGGGQGRQYRRDRSAASPVASHLDGRGPRTATAANGSTSIRMATRDRVLPFEVDDRTRVRRPRAICRSVRPPRVWRLTRSAAACGNASPLHGAFGAPTRGMRRGPGPRPGRQVSKASKPKAE